MEKFELHLVDVGACSDVPYDYRTPSLKVDGLGPLTLDLSGWDAVTDLQPQTQPVISGGDADWWNAPTYTTDLIPAYRGGGCVTVMASSGDDHASAFINGAVVHFPLNLGEPLALVDGGASVALTSLPGAYPRGAVEVTDTD